MAKIKPRLNYQHPRRWRKRDGVLSCDGPDAGYPTPAPKAICVACRKSWRKSGTICPHCGGPTVYVNPWARIPRRANKKGWRRIAERLAPSPEREKQRAITRLDLERAAANILKGYEDNER